MNPHQKALDQMFGDMDDMETNKMFPGDKKDANAGVDITISIAPKGSEPDADDFTDGDHDEALCKGGCVYHKGGVVEPEAEDSSELSLPPFLRKKKMV